MPDNAASEGVHSITFRAADDTIHCGGDPADSKEGMIECAVQLEGDPIMEKPADCPLDWGDTFAMNGKGTVNLVCHGDTFYDPKMPLLQAGEKVSGKGWHCDIGADSVRCENSDGHGFSLTTKKQMIF